MNALRRSHLRRNLKLSILRLLKQCSNWPTNLFLCDMIYKNRMINIKKKEELFKSKVTASSRRSMSSAMNES